MENDLKMYRFFIRFIRVERRGRKMRFPGRRARWEIFFSRRRKTFLRKKYFSCVFSFFRKNRLAKLLRWCTFLVPKSRYWCLDRKKLILGPKVDFLPKSALLGAKMHFWGPIRSRSPPGAGTLLGQCFFSYFGAPFPQKGYFSLFLAILEQKVGSGATFPLFCGKSDFGPPGRPGAQNGTPKWLGFLWFYWCSRPGGGGGWLFQHFSPKCIILVISTKFRPKSLK